MVFSAGFVLTFYLFHEPFFSFCCFLFGWFVWVGFFGQFCYCYCWFLFCFMRFFGFPPPPLFLLNLLVSLKAFSAYFWSRAEQTWTHLMLVLCILVDMVYSPSPCPEFGSGEHASHTHNTLLASSARNNVTSKNLSLVQKAKKQKRQQESLWPICIMCQTVQCTRKYSMLINLL